MANFDFPDADSSRNKTHCGDVAVRFMVNYFNLGCDFSCRDQTLRHDYKLGQSRKLAEADMQA